MANLTGKKYGGRKTGTPNKTSKELRDALTIIVQGEIDNLPMLLDTLQPIERIQLLLKLLPYTVARPLPTNSIEGSNNEPFTILLTNKPENENRKTGT